MPTPIHQDDPLRVVLALPELVTYPKPQYTPLEHWQLQEIVREVFDILETPVEKFIRTLSMGVSYEHIYTSTPSLLQASEINKYFMELGMIIWFRCHENSLFKTVVDDHAISGFIDTFPMYLETMGDDFVILAHNDLRVHPAAMNLNML